MLNHTTLADGMNTDDLCEVYFSFLVYNGMEGMEDVSADELLYHYSQDLEDGTDDQITLWLKEFMRIWSDACNAEYKMGHAVSDYHGWIRPIQ